MSGAEDAPKRIDLPTGRPEREPAWTGSNSEPACQRQQREREHARPGSTRAGKLSGPNGRKLSDGEEESKLGGGAKRRSLERLVRHVVLEMLVEQGPTAHRRGNEGCCRRERPTGANDVPGLETRQRSEEEQTRQMKGAGTDTLSKHLTRSKECLTDSSSATEAGHARHGK